MTPSATKTVKFIVNGNPQTIHKSMKGCVISSMSAFPEKDIIIVVQLNSTPGHPNKHPPSQLTASMKELICVMQ